MKTMTREQAITLAETKWWKTKTPREIVQFQLFEDKLCMKFADYHAAVEEVLGRPVWTHEFAFIDALRQEFLGDKPPPTMEELINLIPEAKRILVVAPD